MPRERTPVYGLMAEFDTPEGLLAATKRAHDAGYRKLDAYTPFPMEELGDILEARSTGVSVIILLGGLTGLIVGLGLQYWTTAIDFPVNVGGRPLASWPAFIPITFELTILFAALAAVLGLLALNGLPMPYHPVFNAPRFLRASQDRFFLVIEARDPNFKLDTTREFLMQTGAREVNDVPH